MKLLISRQFKMYAASWLFASLIAASYAPLSFGEDTSTTTSTNPAVNSNGKSCSYRHRHCRRRRHLYESGKTAKPAQGEAQPAPGQ